MGPAQEIRRGYEIEDQIDETDEIDQTGVAMNYFEKNLEVLKEHHPQLADIDTIRPGQRRAQSV